MKNLYSKLLVGLILFAFMQTSLVAQHNVSVQINHFLGDQPFELETKATSEMGQSFTLRRLEYYLSNFSIIHDGGQVMEIDDSYFIVTCGNGNYSTTLDLGDVDVDIVESIEFYIGVDSVNNHGDPAAWPQDHPLAPRWPSMHWGWAAGYRFVALEGKSGPNVDQELQFHCIGNEFFKKITLEINTNLQEDLNVVVNGEYEKLLTDIDINSGVIIHGNDREVGVMIDNMYKNVFTLASSTSSVDLLASQISFYPNPSLNGSFTIENSNSNVGSITVYDMQGRLVSFLDRNTTSFKIADSGTYLVRVSDENGSILSTQKVVVQ